MAEALQRLVWQQCACRKRPIDDDALDKLVSEVESVLEARRESDLPASLVGEAVMDALRELDEVAYVRFASVYREFESVEQFIKVKYDGLIREADQMRCLLRST